MRKEVDVLGDAGEGRWLMRWRWAMGRYDASDRAGDGDGVADRR